VTDIAQPTTTTYWVVLNATGSKAAGQTGPEQVTTFGNGTTMLWSGTDHAAWVGECDRHGVDTGEPYMGDANA